MVVGEPATLFGFNCLFLLPALAAGGGDPVALLPPLVIWLVGLGAVVFLWRRENAEHFTRSTPTG